MSVWSVCVLFLSLVGCACRFEVVFVKGFC